MPVAKSDRQTKAYSKLAKLALGMHKNKEVASSTNEKD